MRSTQIPLFTPETEWVMPEELKDLRGAKEIAIDLETNDPHLKELGSGNVTGKGHIAGIAVAVEGWSGYFPIQHESNGNMDKKLVFSWLQDMFNQEDTTFIFHNAMYDVCWIRAESGLMPHGPLFDTMVAASVIDENRMRYSLDALSKDYLKESKYKYDLQEKTLAWSQGTIKDPMTNMHNLSYDLVKDYAEQDVNLTLKLWNLFNVRLDQEEKVEKDKDVCSICCESTKNLKYINCKRGGVQSVNFGKYGECCKDKPICGDCRSKCTNCPFCKEHSLRPFKNRFPQKKPTFAVRQERIRLKKAAKEKKRRARLRVSVRRSHNNGFYAVSSEMNRRLREENTYAPTVYIMDRTPLMMREHMTRSRRYTQRGYLGYL